MKRVWLLACLLGSACGVTVIGDLGDGSTAGGAAGDSGLAGEPTQGGRADQGGQGPAPAGGESGGESSGGEGGSGEGGAARAGAAAGGEGGMSAGELLPPELTALPVAHFKLDECEGAAIDERSTALGLRHGVDCVPGIDGMSAWFAAEALSEPRRIEFADEPRFRFTHELTVAAWIKPEAAPNRYRPIVSKWYYADSYQLGLNQVIDGDVLSDRFAFSIAEPEGDDGRPADVLSPGLVELGVWTHVAGVYRWSASGQVARASLYVNGDLVAFTSTKVGTDGLQQSDKPLLIGTVGGGTDFVGAIDEVRLYDVALGPELKWLYLDPTHP